jgi:hypothetical protein
MSEFLHLAVQLSDLLVQGPNPALILPTQPVDLVLDGPAHLGRGRCQVRVLQILHLVKLAGTVLAQDLLQVGDLLHVVLGYPADHEVLVPGFLLELGDALLQAGNLVRAGLLRGRAGLSGLAGPAESGLTPGGLILEEALLLGVHASGEFD